MDYKINSEKLYERFCSYAQIDTTSDDSAEKIPTSSGQWILAELLRDELLGIGAENVRITEYGYVLAEIPANTDENLPAIGLVAHLDTSNEVSGKNVKVKKHYYSGGDLKINEDTVLSLAEFPELAAYAGQDILTSDGTTLLGADDKAGITAIVSACEYLLQNQDLKHGKICLAFTPDEEIGRGTEHFPLEDFGADFAYTVDGGQIGELNCETFNACNAHIVFNGRSVHPGAAKNKMRNALTLATEWQNALPAGERPEYTESYEGFYHCLRISGGVERVELDMILRDHDSEKLAKRKALLIELTEFFNKKYGAGSVECKLNDVYKNMKEYILPVWEIVTGAERAMLKAGVKPVMIPIRGGTDGARLSEFGLPCPNIFTGGHNFHSRYEYLPLNSLVKCVEVILNIVVRD